MIFRFAKFNKLLIAMMIFMLPFSVSAQASFRSSSYVIYENIHHEFDGPTITAGSVSVDGTTVTVTWSTNVTSDGFVVYSTDSGFVSSKEQGSSVKSGTSHSVAVTGLEGETTYYYKVKSTRVNGGETEGTSGTFVTGAGAETVTPPSSGGGGIIIIDKTDKISPTISGIGLQLIDANAVRIFWQTDEDSTSFVEYGPSIAYGHTYGQWEYDLSHEVVLEKLIPDTTYNFRAISSDANGNVAYSDNIIFNTGEGLITEIEPVEEILPPEIVEPEDTLSLLEYFRRLFPDLVDTERLLDVGSMDDLSNLIPIPILSGAPEIDIGPDSVTVYWSTDRDSNSTIAIAPEDRYFPEASEPYQQIVGNTENFVREHEVTAYNLEPDTVYHYQIRSRSKFGPTISSGDYTFRTTAEELEITSFFTLIIDNQTAVFKWITNKASDSAVRFSPYHGNIIAIDEQKTVINNDSSVIHEVMIEDFEGGVFYDVELVSMDEIGNVAVEILPRFSTSEEDLPPIISHIKTDSTVFVDRSDKIQTIISWLTNEPSTSQVYYQEGVHGGNAQLKESTSLNTSFSKEHIVVISKFVPGKVYTFRVESSDSGDSVTISKVHTFMTAKKRESILQIIMNILENTFGWVKRLFP